MKEELGGISRIGVAGAGSMGSGIAQLAASAGHTVILTDSNALALKRAHENIEKSLNTQVEKSRLSSEAASATLARLHFPEDLQGLERCDFVIEAIVEDLRAKQELFAEMEDITASDTIFATNTSSLSVTAIASGCKRHPERVLGVHLFNPATIMPLVEIVPALSTSEKITRDVRAMIERWGKTVVLAKDTPGFIVNRIARPYYGEALRMLEENLADAPTIDWAMREIGGFKMGPFELMDFIGNDVNFKVTESVFQAFFYEPRYRPSFYQKRLVEAGYLGRKSGRGFYNYAPGAANPEPRKDRSAGERILNRILSMLINEAADALYLQVASAKDIDLAMTKGVNYPRGLLAWADQIGPKNVLASLDELHSEYGEDRYRASALLRRMAKNGQKFHG